MLFFVLKIVHVLSGAVLFGTGAGIAFFMLRANATREARTVVAVGRIVVLADMVFTATAVVVQPLSGLGLVLLQGWSPFEPWLVVAYGLYGLVGLCWLPVVWIQIRMLRLAETAVRDGAPLPAAYHRLFAWWFVLGWPAFAGVMGIYVLMVAKPVF
ncbi:DUF2269 domain-containing protein [uncultured Brevundimonas sp.]|uniref:DUF2269 family protein n=1 Tax=uncultured Brevundimonas sp. TaxID=213418 RepID=UPI0030EB7D31|tara:strand:+ start:37029 stop:37496 length:468 start_codon:yes stop_codon:yes gene_type:complete